MTQPKRSSVECLSSVLIRDEAQIAYISLGKGPSLLVIPGALSIATDYLPFAQELAGSFTVHILERRGRGASSPQGPKYDMEQECGDLRALQQETGATFVVGHSFGGLIALEAARNNSSLRRVAVYEPGISVDGSIPMNWIPSYRRLLADGKRMNAFLAYSLATGPDRARRTPPWVMRLFLPMFVSNERRNTMLDLLDQNLLEHKEIARLDSQIERYREVHAEVLLLSGDRTGISYLDLAIEHLDAVLPNREAKNFPSLDHFGIIESGRRQVAEAVKEYFIR